MHATTQSSARASGPWSFPWLAVGLTLGVHLVGQQVPWLAEDRLRMPAGMPAAVDVALADVDGDGQLDTIRVSADTVTVLLQSTSGEFASHPLQAPLRFPGASFRTVAVGSFVPRSALIDILVVRAAAAPLVLANDGTGRFAPATVALPPPPVPVAGVLVGDLDRSPPDDVLVLPDQGRPQLLLGQASGYIDASSLLPAGLFVQAPVGALADFDSDGDIDIVLASGVTSVPFVLENNGGFMRQIALPVSGAYTALSVGDFDRDGWVDVALARATPLPTAIDFMRNLGGRFTAHALTTPFLLDAPATRMHAIDLLRDGTTDLVMLQSDGQLRVGLNDGLPSFQFRYPPPPLAAAPRVGLAVGDLEGDGDVDMVVVGGVRAGSFVRDSVLLGRANGADWLDTEAVGFPIGPLPGSAVGAAVDIDGDAELDVVAYSQDGRGVAFRNDGSARFAETAGVLPALAMRGVRRVLRASIVTQARDLVIVASAAGGTAQPPGLRVLLAQGGSYVDVSARLPAALQRGLDGVAVEKVLLPAAGPRLTDDLVVVDTAGNLAVIANLNGNFAAIAGAFAPAVAAASVRALLTGDVNGDDRQDVVLVEFGVRGGGLQVYLRTNSNVAPLFVEAPPPTVGFGVVERALADDFDGDGDLDILATLDSNAVLPLVFLAGNGRGDFVDTTAATFVTPLPGRVDALVSMTAPGQQRALLLGRDDGEPLQVLRRQGRRFTASQVQPLHGSPRVNDLVVADFDTDGDDDCAVFASGTAPSLLLGTDTHLAGRTIAQARREIALRVRGPDAAAIGAWLWSPGGTARVPLLGFGILRLAPPVTSLAVFPFGLTRTVEIAFPAPASPRDIILAFQVAVFDTRSGAVSLSNLEPLLLTTR